MPEPRQLRLGFALVGVLALLGVAAVVLLQQGGSTPTPAGPGANAAAPGAANDTAQGAGTPTATTAADPGTSQRVEKPTGDRPGPFEERFGIRFVGATLTANATVVDVRYRVTDQAKAARLADDQLTAAVVDLATGARVDLRTPPANGAAGSRTAIRAAHKNGAFPPEPRATTMDGTGFVLVPNTRNALRPGSKVCVRIGDLDSPPFELG